MNAPLYQVWPSKSRFCCYGRYVTGPSEDFCTNAYTWVCICGISVPYIVLIGPILWNELSPAVSFPTYFLFLSTIFFLWMTQCSDPGIIPRREVIKMLNDPDLEQYVAANEPTQQYDGNQILIQQNNPLIYQQRVKTCTTCFVVRPPRSAHCSSCDNCVLVHDHHCPFVNNCIGKNNYRYFISFVFSLCALSVSVISGLICFFVLLGYKGMSSSAKLTVLIIFVIPIGVAGLCVLSLCSYHIFLRIIGKTTRENLKKQATADTEEQQFLWFSGSVTLFNPQQIVRVQIPTQQNDVL